jgi:hypothetical protein
VLDRATQNPVLEERVDTPLADLPNVQIPPVSELRSYFRGDIDADGLLHAAEAGSGGLGLPRETHLDERTIGGGLEVQDAAVEQTHAQRRTTPALNATKPSERSFPALGKLNEAGTITSTADVARSGSLAFAETILAASRVRIGITISRFPAAKAVMIASRISGTISRQVSGVSAATRPG